MSAMVFMVAGMVVVFLVSALNLLLMFGVIRRLRQHTELLGDRGSFMPATDPTVPVGSSPGDFVATGTDGRLVSRDLMHAEADRTIVAFFAPDCSSCAAGMADFVLGLTEFPGGVDRSFAIVFGDAGDGEVASVVAKLERAARVVVEPVGGVIAEAFGVATVPAMCLLDGSGTVVAIGRSLDDLAEPATV